MRFSPTTLSLLALVLVTSSAFAGGGSAPSTPSNASPVLRTDASRQPSYARPEVGRPEAHVESWGVVATPRPIPGTPPTVRPLPQSYWVAKRSDPYRIDLRGVNRGSSLRVTMQEPSDRVELPHAVARAPLASAAERHLVNRAFDKQLAANVSKAVREKELFTTKADVDGPKQTQSIERPEILPTHAPITVSGRDRFDRRLAPAHATVEGRAAETTAGPIVNGTHTYVETTTSGELVTPYVPWAKMENVFSTPAYVREGKTFAKMLGLAAFPRNANVTLTNTRMRSNGEEGSSVKIAKLSSAGAGAIEVPALPGDRIEIEVAYPAVPGRAQGASQKFTYDVPIASKHASGYAVAPHVAKGVPYVRVAPGEAR